MSSAKSLEYDVLNKLLTLIVSGDGVSRVRGAAASSAQRRTQMSAYVSFPPTHTTPPLRTPAQTFSHVPLRRPNVIEGFRALLVVVGACPGTVLPTPTRDIGAA